uniref:Glycylpeptide N-tetradecanoyltransferase n=1 Tax=Plectus sambesii TaxID=2011161 RepID=A0A914UXR4_9BILA
MPKDEQQNSAESANSSKSPPNETTKSGGSSEDDGKSGAKDAASGTSDTAGSSMNDLARQLRQLDVLTLNQRSAAKDMDEAKRRKFAFWETQPVPKFDEQVTTNEPIDQPIDISQVREEPFSLPDQFHWSNVDLDDEKQLKELYTLLTENYVEDDDNMFRFDYGSEFIRWALKPPGWLQQWHCGVRAKNSGKLVAFISAIPCTIRIYDKIQTMVEINFLCVHKKLRSKRVAPVLIREITRRVNQQGIFQAVFTAGVIIPKPITTCRYWHRSLNPKKLIEVKFSHLARNMTLQRTLKLYKLPEAPKCPGFRAMAPGDVPQAYRLLVDYLKTFDLAPMFTLEEFQHFFVPRPNVVDSFVVETNGKVTDFVSFYTLPSTVMHHSTYKTIKAAYSFYNVATSTSLVELMNDALIVAKKHDFDVFNALDLMDNKQFLSPVSLSCDF